MRMGGIIPADTPDYTEQYPPRQKKVVTYDLKTLTAEIHDFGLARPMDGQWFDEPDTIWKCKIVKPGSLEILVYGIGDGMAMGGIKVPKPEEWLKMTKKERAAKAQEI